VTGISVPKVNFRRIRDPVDETSLINQPPPTPVGVLSRDESDRVRKASISVTKNSSVLEEPRKDVTKQIKPEVVDKSLDPPTEEELGVLNNETDEKEITETEKDKIVSDETVDAVNTDQDNIKEDNNENKENIEETKVQTAKQRSKNKSDAKLSFFLTEESKSKDGEHVDEGKQNKEFLIGVTISSTDQSGTVKIIPNEDKTDGN